MCVFCNVSTFGQSIQEHATTFLDSNKIDLRKVYLCPKSVESMFVNKEPDVRAVFIYSKKPPVKFLTLSEIIKKHTKYNDLDSLMVFRINDKLREDIQGIQIDENYFIYVKVETLNNLQHIKEAYKDLKLVSIDLELEKRKPVIHLRGEEINKIKK